MTNLFDSRLVLDRIQKEFDRDERVIKLEKRVLYLETLLENIINDVEESTSGFLRLSRHFPKDPSVSPNSGQDND